MPNKLDHAQEDKVMTTVDKLSRSARITGLLAMTCMLGGSIYQSLLVTGMLMIVFMPTVVFLYYRSTLPARHKGSSETIFWIYFFTATISTAILMVVQAGIAYSWAALFFGADLQFFLDEYASVSKYSDIRDEQHRAARAEFASRPSYWAFIICATFTVAGLCEEVQKYVPLAITRRRKKVSSTTEYLIYGATAGLAFSTIENILFVWADVEENASKIVLTLVERLLLGTSAHMLAGSSTALKMARRDLRGARMSIAGILMRSVLCHGLFDLGLVAVCALRGQVGWVHPEDPLDIGCCVGWVFMVLSILLVLVRFELKKLKED